MPSGPLSKQDANLSVSALLDGAESWDWEDMENEFLTPGRKRNKVRCATSCFPLILISVSVYRLSRESLYQGPFRSLCCGRCGNEHAAWLQGQAFPLLFFGMFSTLRTGLVGEN